MTMAIRTAMGTENIVRNVPLKSGWNSFSPMELYRNAMNVTRPNGTRTASGRLMRRAYASKARSVHSERRACRTESLKAFLSQRQLFVSLASFSLTNLPKASSKAATDCGFQRREFTSCTRCSWNPRASAAKNGVPQAMASIAQKPTVSMQLADADTSEAAKANATSDRPKNFGTQNNFGFSSSANVANSGPRGPSPTKANVTLLGARRTPSIRKRMSFSNENRPT
mmetsp:Transcript_113628/g.242591  ORF Transcript_113628/g.242591 Transcript_113628/m.242591 type:complete len:226 (-) Transcript_113628:761-1438(-)